jgi:hypothetical protein
MSGVVPALHFKRSRRVLQSQRTAVKTKESKAGRKALDLRTMNGGPEEDFP